MAFHCETSQVYGGTQSPAHGGRTAEMALYTGRYPSDSDPSRSVYRCATPIAINRRPLMNRHPYDLLPELAGLASYGDAARIGYSVDENVRRLVRYHWVERSLMGTLIAR